MLSIILVFYNIDNNKSFASIPTYDALLSTLHVWCCLVYVNTFCWALNHHSFALCHFRFSNLYPFGSCLVVVHLLSSILDSPTSTPLDLIVKLVHYVGFWLCIFQLMGLCTHANKLLKLMEFCVHALHLMYLKFILEKQWL